MSNTPFVPQSELSQKVCVETIVPALQELTLQLSTDPSISPEVAVMRLLGTLRHGVHPQVGEALEGLTEALRNRFVDAYMEQLHAWPGWGVIEGPIALDGSSTVRPSASKPIDLPGLDRGVQNYF